MILFSFLLIGCNEEKPKPVDPQRAAIKDKLSDATSHGLMQSTFTIKQSIHIYRQFEKIQNIDSLRTWVDSIAPLIFKGQHAVGGTANLVCTWRGYERNVMVKTFSTDSIYSEKRIMDYCKAFQSQDKNMQLVHLYFFKGKAPAKMPAPEFERTNPDDPDHTGSYAVQTFIKSKKPYATVSIYGEGEYKYHQGFEY